MHYRKLDKDGDMIFGHGRKDYLSEAEAVAQSVLTRLRLWKGEWYLDTEEGTPYLPDILGKGTESSALSALHDRILETEGVKDIVSIDGNVDEDSRHATFTITLDTIYGEVVVNG